jgi:hypothetical protein
MNFSASKPGSPPAGVFETKMKQKCQVKNLQRASTLAEN